MNATIANKIAEARNAKIMSNLGNRKTGWKYVGAVELGNEGRCGITGARLFKGVTITNAKAGLTLNVGVGAMLKFTDAKLPKLTKAEKAAQREVTIAKIKATKAARRAGAGDPAASSDLSVVTVESRMRALYASYQVNPW